jgi:hypothetical protein
MPEDLIKIIVASVSGVAGGVIAAIITAQSKVRELEQNFRLAQQAKEAEDRAKNQLQYLNPLRITTMDFRWRMDNITDRIRRKDTLLTDTLNELESKLEDPTADSAEWANGFGEFALSTQYTTMLYFARAARIRSELPFVRLSSDDDEELLNKLSEVRRSLGGDYGIWESLQDSLGSYMWKEDSRLLTYREFCSQLLDSSAYSWFHRPIEFYRDLDKKTPEERQKMIDSLTNLERFMAERPRQTARGRN